MPRTFQFLAPSLHPNTLTDLAIPEAGPSAPEPVVKHQPIKYGQHHPVGLIKRMKQVDEHEIVIADDAYRLSALSLSDPVNGVTSPPEVVRQHQAKGKAGSTWAGLASVQAGTIGALSSGAIHLLPSSNSSSSDVRSTTIPGSLTCIASSSSSATAFAAAGKEVDVSIWDVERTFAAAPRDDTSEKNGKRKKNELREGEIWQAKNLAHDNLNLRPPIHHLALTFAPNSSTSLVSGTKSGSIRRYDTRQRKPISDWKVAREGGIGAISFGSGEHELFYADRASLLAVLDMRTGKMLYTLPSTCTVHQLVSFPPIDEDSNTSGRRVGLAGIGSDATLRTYATTPIPEEGVKGNWGGEGKKACVVGMVGGVGVGEFVWRGYGEVAAKKKKEKRERAEVEGEDDEDGEDEEAEDEEVWDGMDEIGNGAVGDDSEDDDEDEEDSEEEEEPPMKRKRQPQ